MRRIQFIRPLVGQILRGAATATYRTRQHALGPYEVITNCFQRSATSPCTIDIYRVERFRLGELDTAAIELTDLSVPVDALPAEARAILGLQSQRDALGQFRALLRMWYGEAALDPNFPLFQHRFRLVESRAAPE